nr:hypothetical protein [Salidesulfovibrio brasiliensis]
MLKFILGTKNDRYLKKLKPLIKQINAFEPEYEKLADEQLPQKIEELKDRVQNQGASLDDVLPECFALVREAGKRTMEMRHYDVQLIGGIVLHQARLPK